MIRSHGLCRRYMPATTILCYLHGSRLRSVRLKGCAQLAAVAAATVTAVWNDAEEAVTQVHQQQAEAAGAAATTAGGMNGAKAAMDQAPELLVHNAALMRDLMVQWRDDKGTKGKGRDNRGGFGTGKGGGSGKGKGKVDVDRGGGGCNGGGGGCRGGPYGGQLQLGVSE